MTQILQSDQHPDADQLNAFVEHALPPHEQQQIMSHIAVCPGCRQVIYLAQPMVVEEAVSTPRPVAARGWFSGWNLALPVGLTVSFLVILGVHLRNISIGNNQSRADKVARVEQSAAPSQSTPPTAQAVPPGPAPAPIRKASASASLPTNALASSSPSNSIPAQSELKLSSLNGSLTSPERAAPPILNQTALSGAGLGSEANQSAAGTGFRSASPSPPVPAAASAPASQSAALNNVDTSHRELRSSATQYNSASVTSQINLNQALQAAPPPLPAPPAPAAANETVTVTNAPAVLETKSDVTSEVITGKAMGALAAPSMKMKKQPSLPSHLRAVATVSNTRQEVAIDTAGSLFRSQDAGVSWQSVPVQWSGRAVKLQVAPIPATPFVAAGADSATTTSAAKGSPMVAARTMFELTNEAGVVWISVDGETWTHK